jgi:hypothetical protein
VGSRWRYSLCVRGLFVDSRMEGRGGTVLGVGSWDLVLNLDLGWKLGSDFDLCSVYEIRKSNRSLRRQKKKKKKKPRKDSSSTTSERQENGRSTEI